jgi:two-component system CheB/CheR fusion protein
MRGTLVAKASLEDETMMDVLPEVEILTVEDSPELLAIYSKVLELGGATVRRATSMKEALGEYLKREPDIILCDLCMPGGDGFALIQAVRAIEGEVGHHVPAAALTGLSQASDIARALAAGFDAFVMKPVSARVLVSLTRALAAKAQERLAPDLGIVLPRPAGVF